MARDAQGLEVTGAPASVDALNGAISDYLGWTGDPVAVLQQAVDADPGFNLGHSALASLFMLNGFRGDHPMVARALADAEATVGGASTRERRHLAAARAWADGQIIAATNIWEDVLLDYPTDALALRFAHDTYFYLGHSLSIRDSVARALPAWDPSGPNYGFVLGQYAFGLEEAGELAKAESTARRAIDLNPEDAWAIHAVAHVLETESRQQEGVAFLKGGRRNWSKAHALAVHNGWHLALYLLEDGRFDEILADYDSYVAPKLAGDSLLDLVDAAALLWRIELAGGQVADRWAPVARQWMTHVDDHVLVFNDLHIAMAVARAADAQGVRTLRRSLDDYARVGHGDNHDVTLDVGRRLVDGVLAFADGDDARAIELILPVRYKIVRIGGSHAQRDLLTQTLIAAAERSGAWPLAKALLAERLAVRPTDRTRRNYARAKAAQSANATTRPQPGLSH